MRPPTHPARQPPDANEHRREPAVGSGYTSPARRAGTLSARQAAQEAGVPVRLLRRALWRGHVPGTLVRGRWMISRAAWHAFLDD